MPWDNPSRSERRKRRRKQAGVRDGRQRRSYRRRMSKPRLALAQRLRSCARWQKLRLWYLRRHPFCEQCDREGRVTPAAEVDHIRPLRWFPLARMEGAAYDEGNLQALCEPCHDRKSAREQAIDRREAEDAER